MKIRPLTLPLLALLTLNCGSIVHQTTQQVRIDSDPAGAAITVSCGDAVNDPKLVTPAVVTLHRKPAHCGVKLSKEAYRDKEMLFTKSLSPTYLGNVVFGGVIGLIVDAANGAMWNRVPGRDVKVTLEKNTAEEE
ncbi:MAG: hypothetical protein WBX15_02170 [Thermoanaerobaculia bacterium]